MPSAPDYETGDCGLDPTDNDSMGCETPPVKCP